MKNLGIECKELRHLEYEAILIAVGNVITYSLYFLAGYFIGKSVVIQDRHPPFYALIILMIPVLLFEFYNSINYLINFRHAILHKKEENAKKYDDLETKVGNK